LVFGAQFAEVEVDLETGKVAVVRLVAAHDVGRALNPTLVEGQIEGGVAMGIGYALTEELVYDPKGGAVLNTNLLDYKVPTVYDVPDVESILVETFDPDGPYGAKAVGEPPTIPTAAAISNAFFAATGRRLRSLPLTPEKVWRALR
jgi:xanthine dehydrogenase molybdenum-binding subunit